MAKVITAEHPKRGALWASFDPSVHHIEGRVAESRFAARMAPFPDEASARHALKLAGAKQPEAAR